MPVPLDVDLPHREAAQIVIDGVADEAEWADALLVEDWVTYFPSPGLDPEVHATARMLSDESGFYLFYEVIDPEPELIRARLTRRDQVWGDDLVGIYLDPAGDAQRGYLFFCNPFGVQADATRMAGKDDQFSWDGQWESQGQLTESGFQVEVFIPWSTVRHPADMEQVGVSLLRVQARTGERSSWPVRDPDVSGILIQENLLGGPGPVGTGVGLTLIPSLTFGWSDTGAVEHPWNLYGVSPGLTVRYDPVPALTLLATANPDYSQVETDANQINVNRRYALYFQERRPFFQEGREWFDTEFGDVIYTRSMTNPRYGARATVEAGGWALAALHVMDASPADSVTEGDSWGEAELGTEDARVVALDTVVRSRRALRGDGSVGVVFSDKTLAGQDLASRTAGVDARVRLSDTWVASASALGSMTDYAERETQLSPAGSLLVAHDSRRFEAGTYSWFVPTEFRVENGFQTRADLWNNGVWGGFKLYPSRGPFKRIGINPLQAAVGVRPSDGQVRDVVVDPYTYFQLSNGTGGGLGVTATREVFQDTDLRYVQGQADWGGRVTRRLGLYGTGTWGTGPSYDELVVGDFVSAGGSIDLVPTRRLFLSTDVSWERLSVDGDLLYAGWVGRGRVEAYATQSLWARALVDYSSFDKQWGGNLVFAYQRSPGRAVFLGTDVRQHDAGVSWQVFAKASWVFQL